MGLLAARAAAVGAAHGGSVMLADIPVNYRCLGTIALHQPPPPALLPPQSCAGTNAPLGTTTLYCFPALPIDVLRALSCFAKIRIAQEYRAFLKRYFDKKNFDDCFFVYDRLMAHPVFFVFFIFVVSSVVLCFGWGGCCGFPSAGPRSRPVLNFPGALT